MFISWRNDRSADSYFEKNIIWVCYISLCDALPHESCINAGMIWIHSTKGQRSSSNRHYSSFINWERGVSIIEPTLSMPLRTSCCVPAHECHVYWNQLLLLVGLVDFQRARFSSYLKVDWERLESRDKVTVLEKVNHTVVIWWFQSTHFRSLSHSILRCIIFPEPRDKLLNAFFNGSVWIVGQ